MNELQQMLDDTVTRLFGDLVTKESLQDAETWADSEAVWPDALWRSVEENGLTQPVTPEIMGGVGAAASGLALKAAARLDDLDT